MQRKTYISLSPDKPGSVFALFYFESGPDIHGWHIEARRGYFSAAFFMVENFYASRSPRLYRSVEDDVYDVWTIDCPPTRDEIRCPLPEPVAHALEQAQSEFVDEWLFFGSDTGIEAELSAYATHGRPVGEVNMKARRLPRLQKDGSLLVHASAGVDLNLVQLVRKYWRLNEKIAVD